MDFMHTFRTDGEGLWTTTIKNVAVTHIDIGYVDDENEFGELRVFFNTASWDVENDGLIYTDKLFQAMLRLALTREGLAGDDVSYSEQGMQGNDFVSLDVGKQFMKSWNNLSKA